MDPIVLAFGRALVSAAATESWQQARAGVITLWHRWRPVQQTEAIDGELDALHERVLVARRDNRTEAEQALAGVWQGRLQELLLDQPSAADELRRILTDVLGPALTPAEQVQIGQVTMTGHSHDSSTFNQVAGNQHNIKS